MAILFAGATGAAADGDPPRIGVDPARVPAGGTVTVHGIDFADAGPVAILLVGTSGSGTRIGAATADEHGGFMAAVMIPAETLPGEFRVRAVPAEGEPVEGVVTVGPPVPQRGEQRGADEPLIAPMPSGAAPAVAAPTVPASSAISAGSSPANPGPMGLGSLAIVLALLLALGGVAWARSRRAARSATSGSDLP